LKRSGKWTTDEVYLFKNGKFTLILAFDLRKIHKPEELLPFFPERTIGQIRSHIQKYKEKIDRRQQKIGSK
jgi:hypothetical protein